MKQIIEHLRKSAFASRVLVVSIVVAGLVTGPVACETSPPVQEMSDARQAIMVAKEAGAAELAKVHLISAERYLASAERLLSERAYHQARRDAKQAKMKALDALKASEASKKD